MSNSSILVSGPTIAKDEELVNKLQSIAVVLKNSQNTKIETILKDQKVDLILFEMLEETASELRLIKKIKTGFPNIAIILINGDREFMAEAFSYGVKDAFRKPYKCSLIAERVNAILQEVNDN